MHKITDCLKNKWGIFIRLLKTYLCFVRGEKHWRRRFIRLVLAGDKRGDALAKEFIQTNISVISGGHLKNKKVSGPILICVIKDDAEKIVKFLNHYRRLGIELFLFLDNESKDGTKEILCGQKDTIVFSSTQQYSSERRIAWINRLIAYKGINNWYLVADSDEFVTYIGSEEHTFQDIIKICEARGYERVEGFMIDMYSKDTIFSRQTADLIEKQYNYFDYNTYKYRKQFDGKIIRGGPRYRIFKRNMRLSKFPLFYFGEDSLVASSHYMFPFEKNWDVPCNLAILHYKFIDQKDYQKLVNAVKNKNYSCGSSDYIQYMRVLKSHNKNLNFYSEAHSREYRNSDDLRQIKILEEALWEEK